MRRSFTQFYYCLLFVSQTLPAFAQDAGSLETISIASQTESIEFQFRFCPNGTLFVGMPDTSGAQSGTPVAIKGFYIGEAEVTVSQLRAILGADGISPLVERARIEEKNKPEYRIALESGSEEPAIFVGLEDAVQFCKAVEESVESNRLRSSNTTVESRLFRLPGYAEWQYAARAVAKADERPELMHFNRWPQMSELTQASQQKCNEVWLSMGKQGAFPGLQKDFLTLSTATNPSDIQKVREVLEEAFTIAFKSQKRSAAGLGILSPVRSTLPNAWNVFDMHESVREWTLWAASADPRLIWDRLKNRPDMSGFENAFLSGGSFNDSFFEPNSLSRFTFWGGKLTEGKPGPIAYSTELVEDQVPGFRMAMDRVLAKDWLFVVRRAFRKGEEAPDELATSERLVQELTEVDARERKIMAFYSTLNQNRDAGQEIAAVLRTVAEIKDEADPAVASTSAADKLNALVKKPKGSTNASSATPDANDDQIYMRFIADRL